jgi:hypothetical protein
MKLKWWPAHKPWLYCQLSKTRKFFLFLEISRF